MSATTLEHIVAQAKDAGKPVDSVTAAFTLGYLSGKAFAKALRVGQGKTVCVTGATGFVASHCVQQLLAAGYTVHGTVRRPLDTPGYVGHLTSLPGAAERLKLFNADLVNPGSFDKAIAGCDVVFHTASPFNTNKDMTEEDFCKPAIEGTLEVLSAMERVGVKTCILTSSTAAVYCFTKDHTPDKIYTDDDWSNPEKLRELKLWYPLSKTVAERTAHDFAADHGMVLKSINPTYIFGPRLQSRVNESTNGILKFMNGSTEVIKNGSKCIVDVRDVARAHVLAYQKVERDGPNSFGSRVICIAACPKWSEIAAQVAVSVPASHTSQVRVPSEVQKPGAPGHIPDFIHFDCINARAIGLQFTPWTQTVTDTVSSIIAHGDLD